MKRTFSKLTLIALLTVLLSTFASAEAAAVIDAKADKVIEIFKQKPGAAKFLSEVQGYIVFPSVIKGGFIWELSTEGGDFWKAQVKRLSK